MSAGCLPVLCLRSLSGTQGGGSSVLLMAAIISKVTNAINMENSLLITRPALGLSAARFNHHTHSLDKQSFNHHTAMPANTIQQSANLQIRRLDGWIPSDTVYIHSAVRWTVATRVSAAWDHGLMYSLASRDAEWPTRLREDKMPFERNATLLPTVIS